MGKRSFRTSTLESTRAIPLLLPADQEMRGTISYLAPEDIRRGATVRVDSLRFSAVLLQTA